MSAVLCVTRSFSTHNVPWRLKCVLDMDLLWAAVSNLMWTQDCMLRPSEKYKKHISPIWKSLRRCSWIKEHIQLIKWAGYIYIYPTSEAFSLVMFRLEPPAGLFVHDIVFFIQHMYNTLSFIVILIRWIQCIRIIRIDYYLYMKHKYDVYRPCYKR